MKTWHIEGADKIHLSETMLQKVEGEVKVKMSKVAVLSTDITFLADENSDTKGITVPGHSGIAYISEDNESMGMKMGERIVVSPFISYEEYGIKKIKVKGVDCDGFLSDFVSVPEENIHALPDGIQDEEAVFTDFIALGINILDYMDTNKGDHIVILGANTLGILLSQLAIYYQMVPILIDLDAEKLAIAESFGVYYTLNPTLDNIERKVEELTGGRMADFSVYVGESVPFSSSMRLVKDRGVVVIAGYSTRAKHQIDMDMVLGKQLTLKGVANGKGGVETAINLLANKIIKTDRLIDVRVDFEDVAEVAEKCIKYPYQYDIVLVNI